MSRSFEPGSPRAASIPLGERRPARSIRVLLADDHRLLRETLRMLLELRNEVEVVGEADDGREAVDMAEQLKPDVVLMDMGMPGLNGIEATQLIRRRLPRTRVLMLSGYDQDDRVTAALRAGAAGYVVKNAPVEELLKAIQEVSQAGTYLSAAIADRAFQPNLTFTGRLKDISQFEDIVVRAGQDGRIVRLRDVVTAVVQTLSLPVAVPAAL